MTSHLGKIIEALIVEDEKNKAIPLEELLRIRSVIAAYEQDLADIKALVTNGHTSLSGFLS